MQPPPPPWMRRAHLLFAAIFLPHLLSWCLGTGHPLLSILAVPGAALAGVPALLGPVGALLVVALAALRTRVPALAAPADLLALWGALAFVGPAVAATRPLPWIPVAVGLWWWGRGRAAGASPWDLPPTLRAGAGALLWCAASRVRPFGDGLLPTGVEDAIAAGVLALPDALLTLPCLALGVAAGLALHRRARGDVRGAALGLGLALLANATFGGGSAWVSAGFVGALAGAWPAGRGRVEGVVGPILLAVLLASVRIGGLERWNCDAIDRHPVTKLLLKRSDLTSLGVVPGNLPYLVALRGDGSALERFSTTGVVNETKPVDPPGGLLLSTGGNDAPVLRLVEGPEGLIVEWWRASVMQREAVAVSTEPCHPTDAGYEPVSQRVWVACADGDVVALDPVHPAERWPMPGETQDLDQAPGSVVRLRRGPMGHLVLRDPTGVVQASTFVGPWSAAADPGPERLVVAHGPAGQITLRGAPPHIEGRPGGAPRLEGIAALERDVRHILGRARVGNWPSEVHWTLATRSVYVTSEVDARVTLVDGEVPWHQHSVPLGAPPRQVVVDSPSGTLYGVNRCGVFEVRIQSTFPWASSGDVEPATPTPAPAGPTPTPREDPR